MRLFLLLILCSLLMSCSTVPGNVDVGDGVCTADYTPVCAKNASVVQTYSNRCTAERERAYILHEGPCRSEDVIDGDKPQFCTQEYAPVCAEVVVQCVKAPCYPVRSTYGNACEASVADARIVYKGECKDTATKRYVSVDKARCDAIRFECDEYQEPFFDETGCGCEQVRQ